MTKKTNGKERAVLVTTEHRGVFFGYTDDTSGDIIKLRAARNCIYWPTEQKGFLGLASKGPLKGSRIGPAPDMSCVRSLPLPPALKKPSRLGKRPRGWFDFEGRTTGVV